MNTFLLPPVTLTLADALPLVAEVVRTITRRLPPHVSSQDLESAGKLALVEVFADPAVAALDAQSMRAYCITRVRGAVLDELRRGDPLSRHSRAQVNLVRKTVASLEISLGRVPTSVEVAAVTGLTPAVVQTTAEVAAAAESLAAVSTRAHDEALKAIADPTTPSPAETAEASDVSDSLHAALARIPTKQAYVLRRYYLEDSGLEVIAAELQVSTARVHQLRVAGENRLRADLAVLAAWQTLLTGG